MEHWSIEDYNNYQNSGKIRKSKYRANKTSIDGHSFDSQKEAEYYCDLKLRLQAGQINGFCLQPTFILAPGLKYKADFIIFGKDGSTEVVDVKGFKTKEYIAKKKVFEVYKNSINTKILLKSRVSLIISSELLDKRPNVSADIILLNPIEEL